MPPAGVYTTRYSNISLGLTIDLTSTDTEVQVFDLTLSPSPVPQPPVLVTHCGDQTIMAHLLDSVVYPPVNLDLPTVALDPSGTSYIRPLPDRPPRPAPDFSIDNPSPRWSRGLMSGSDASCNVFASSEFLLDLAPFPQPPRWDAHYQRVIRAIDTTPELYPIIHSMNLTALRELLAPFPNIKLVESVIDGYTNGFYAGDDSRFQSFRLRPVVHSPVLPSDPAAVEAFSRNIQKELPSRRLEYVDKLPFYSSTVRTFVVQQRGKFRTILDLSHPSGSSFNDWISKEQRKCAYDHVKDLLPAIRLLNQFADEYLVVVLWKIDVVGAFRTQPLHPSLQLRQFLQHGGVFLANRTSSFGDAHAAQRWSVVSGLIADAVRRDLPSPLAWASHYLNCVLLRLEESPTEEIQAEFFLPTSLSRDETLSQARALLTRKIQSLDESSHLINAQIRVYVDDFYGVSLVPSICLQAGDGPWHIPPNPDPDARIPREAQALLDTLANLGLPASPDKNYWGQVLTITGFHIDTIYMTLSIDPDQEAELRRLVERLAQPNRRPIPLKEFQSALGHLNWAATVYPFITPAIRPCYQLFPQATSGSIHLTDAVRENFRWLCHYLSRARPIRLLTHTSWAPPQADYIFLADATPTGIGVYFPQVDLGLTYILTRPFGLPGEQPFHIGSAEMMAQFVGFWFLVKRIIPHFDGHPDTPKRLLGYTDNQGVKHNFDSFSSSLHTNNLILQELAVLEQSTPFEFRVDYVPGADNRVADALSRGHLNEAYSLHPNLKVVQLTNLPSFHHEYDAAFRC
jgi:hypothetical protein